MTQFEIFGMNCAACSARVEKAVKAVKGVSSCSVSLLTNSMRVEGNASAEEIIIAVTKAGYGAEQKGIRSSKDQNASSEDAEKLIPIRLIFSIILLLLLMYLSMGHVMLDWPVPYILRGNPLAVALCELLLSSMIMVINQRFFVNGVKGILKHSMNMDTLVALGSGASWIYSTILLFSMCNASAINDFSALYEALHNMYFESAAMIVTLITVGKMLESRAKGKTTDALRGLMQLTPRKAFVIRNGQEEEVSIEQLNVGDIFAVRTGMSVPADGIIIEGNAALDESSLTGESNPIDKGVGKTVSAATINTSGFIKCRAERVREDTTLSQIIRMVTDASATKAPISRTADKIAAIFVPVVCTIALLTGIIWLLMGKDIQNAVDFAISVLVVSCPCALGLATPVAIMVGSGVGAKNGILFKNAAGLEMAGRIKNVALDKTGTITQGMPEVTDILCTNGTDERQLLTYAVSLESRSSHPLAKAIVRAGENYHTNTLHVEQFAEIPGQGVNGFISGQFISITNRNTNAVDDEKVQFLTHSGKTPMFVYKEDKLLGIIATADITKSDSPLAISEFKKIGIKSVMITGDNERTAQAIGRKVGIDKIIAGVLPGEKSDTVKRLQKSGRTAMIGDGINDAPALMTADLGIAIGAGTDIAIDAADVVLMQNSLSDAVSAIRLGRAVLRNIRENLFWAFIYNAVGIPIAAGILFPTFGIRLSPMICALAMSLSSFCVVSNALRLNCFKGKAKVQESISTEKKKEKKQMKRIMKINGMMCGHCEARVKKCLEALDGVENAEVSFKNGTAIVTFNNEISDEILRKAVEDQDYKVIEIS